MKGPGKLSNGAMDSSYISKRKKYRRRQSCRALASILSQNNGALTCFGRGSKKGKLWSFLPTVTAFMIISAISVPSAHHLPFNGIF